MGLFSDFASLFNTADTNSTNMAIANQNLRFQMENLDYQKALQRELFEREDTSYERTANDMSKAGLNPLTMQGTNGAGDIVPTEAPQLNYQKTPLPAGFGNGLTETLNAVSNLYTQGIERDGLRLENKRAELDNQAQEIKNLIDMDKHGITIDENGNMSMPSFEHKVQEHDSAEFKDKNASAERNQRENEYQENFKTHDNSPREELLLTAAENQLENNNPMVHVGKGALNTALSAYNILKNPISFGVSLIADKANKYLHSEERKAKKEAKKSKKSNYDWQRLGAGNW